VGTDVDLVLRAGEAAARRASDRNDGGRFRLAPRVSGVRVLERGFPVTLRVVTSWRAGGYAAAQARADRLVRAGALIFFVGLVALIALLIPFFFGSENRPSWLNVAAIVGLVAGLGTALGGVVTSVRSPAPPESDETELDGISSPVG
jgi:hypothetical protein